MAGAHSLWVAGLSVREGINMDIATFHARRRFAEVASGRIAYFEDGEGPAALFVHGVPLNGYHWRHVIDRVRHRRRCIAIDLMGLGYSDCSGAGRLVRRTGTDARGGTDALGIEQVDLVGNDSGGAIAQIFAAHHPDRLTSFVRPTATCTRLATAADPAADRACPCRHAGADLPALIDRPDLARERTPRRAGAAVSQLCRPKRAHRRGDPAVPAAAAFLAAAHRGFSALLARLR